MVIKICYLQEHLSIYWWIDSGRLLNSLSPAPATPRQCRWSTRLIRFKVVYLKRKKKQTGNWSQQKYIIFILLSFLFVCNTSLFLTLFNKFILLRLAVVVFFILAEVGESKFYVDSVMGFLHEADSLAISQKKHINS